MQSTTLTPTQMHLLKLFAFNNSEEYAREIQSVLPNGCWTSKLGGSNDIQHSTPYTIQGRLYGNVYCIMKRPMATMMTNN